jgi:hypothetical protein
MRLLVFIVILIPNLLMAQERRAPMPWEGWNSLRTKITPPTVFARAGLRLAVFARIEVDSTDKFVRVTFEPFKTAMTPGENCRLSNVDSAFCSSIAEACRSVRWAAGTVGTKKTTLTAEVPFIFITYSEDSNSDDRETVIVDRLRPTVEVHHIH